MKRYSRHLAICVVIFLAGGSGLLAQNVETVDGVRLVHNKKGGLWGKMPEVSLELVRRIGDIETLDENLAFHYPSDVAVDTEGHVYVLDSGNARIQKFGPDGKFLATIGRKGQGPAEFMMPGSIDFDGNGNLVVNDPMQTRFQVILGEGKDARAFIARDERIYKVRCLNSGNYAAKGSTYPNPRAKGGGKSHGDMRILKILDPEGQFLKEFGRLTEFGETMTNSIGNSFDFDVDEKDAFFVTFHFQNRIEKYSPDGELEWRADRPLNYGTRVKKMGKTDPGKGTMAAPEMNACTSGIAVDGKGRLWIVTFDRQLRKEEEVVTTMTSITSRGGVIGNLSIKTKGDTDLRTTDAFKLEVFSRDGVLLGEIPLPHFVDVIRASGDNLFLVDRDRGTTVYHYRIVEK